MPANNNAAALCIIFLIFFLHSETSHPFQLVTLIIEEILHVVNFIALYFLHKNSRKNTVKIIGFFSFQKFNSKLLLTK